MLHVISDIVRFDISFNSQNYAAEEIENISFDLLLPKTKPISIAIIYKPPTDNRLLDYLSKGFNDFNLMENYLFILGDTNINILVNGQCILDKCKDSSIECEVIRTNSSLLIFFCFFTKRFRA